MGRVRLRHREFKQVSVYDGPYSSVRTRNEVSWDYPHDAETDCVTTCKACQAQLRVGRLSDREYAAACGQRRRTGAAMLMLGVVAVPLGLGVCMVAMSWAQLPSVLLFLVGLLMAVFTTAGAIAGLAKLVVRPQRYFVEEISESQTSPAPGWHFAHSVRGLPDRP